MTCNHKEYAHGHCAEMTCQNYLNKCPKHSYTGSDKKECSLALRSTR